MSKSITDCEENPRPVFSTGTVNLCEIVPEAKPEGSVWRLKICTKGKDAKLPLPGQFFMLRSQKSQLLLARPISVFHAEKSICGVEVSFLILLKGKGTAELCSLDAGDKVQMLGPVGNVFPEPRSVFDGGTDFSEKSDESYLSEKVLIVGGGIGVAPVANFAESLPEKSYDFIACFRSGFYGLEHINPGSLTITTDDGSAGIKGMVTEAVDSEKIKKSGYKAVYACGPAPMLEYIKNISEKRACLAG